ncbi:hypothetical protein ACLMJK_001476 [Lecanora helva]
MFTLNSAKKLKGEDKANDANARTSEHAVGSDMPAAGKEAYLKRESASTVYQFQSIEIRQSPLPIPSIPPIDIPDDMLLIDDEAAAGAILVMDPLIELLELMSMVILSKSKNPRSEQARWGPRSSRR